MRHNYIDSDYPYHVPCNHDRSMTQFSSSNQQAGNDSQLNSNSNSKRISKNSP